MVQPLVGELRFCKGEKKKGKERRKERVRKGGKKEKKEGIFFLDPVLPPLAL